MTNLSILGITYLIVLLLARLTKPAAAEGVKPTLSLSNLQLVVIVAGLVLFVLSCLSIYVPRWLVR